MPLAIRSINLPTGIRLPYAEQGDISGIPMLLLHGPIDSWRSFGPLLENLPFSIHVFAVSQRGHGDADRPNNNYRPEDFAADAIAFMDAVGLKTAILVGHSGSTYTLQHIAINYPERCLGLVMVGSPYDLQNKSAAKKLLHAVAKLNDPIDHEFIKDFVQSTITHPIPQTVLNSLISEASKVPARIWQATLQSLFTSSNPTNHGDITVPTLLVWGEKDQICPRSDQEALMTVIKTAKLLTYKGVGHSPHVERPQKAAKDMSVFAHSLKSVVKF